MQKLSKTTTSNDMKFCLYVGIDKNREMKSFKSISLSVDILQTNLY